MRPGNNRNGASPVLSPSGSTSNGAAGRPRNLEPRLGQHAAAHSMMSPQPRYRHSNGYSPVSNIPTTANGAPAFAAQQKKGWDPASLLNPRGYNSTSSRPVLETSFANNASRQQSQIFQFDNPGGGSQQVYQAPQVQQYNANDAQNGTDDRSFLTNANGNGNEIKDGSMGMGGMGNMLERMHQVTDRSMVPQKRRKINDEQDNHRKAEFNGGGKGGPLGEYMREKRKEGQQESMANGTGPVNLADDDEEVTLVGDSGDKEVCYGRIEGAQITAHKVPTPRPGTRAVSDGFWPQVKIVLRRRYGDKNTIINCTDSTREVIGNIDVNTAIGLAPLLDSQYSLRTAARILTRSRRPGDLAPGTPSVSFRYDLDLTLYGPKKWALAVGKHLSQKQLWLRTPIFVEAGMELHNPHTIQRPAQPPPRQVSYGARASVMRTTEEMKTDIVDMFNSLERSENLPEMNADPRITTGLLRHQKQGLYFMTNKEKERVFDADEKSNSSLWRLNISARGERSYYNVITGQEEVQSPPQVLGGILADMMGLGKTLQIISLVVQTLDNEALAWSKLAPCASQDIRDLCPSRKGKNKVPLPKLEHVPPVINCKTTLLVSPLSTIANWEEQMKQHVKPGTLKYYVYHGANRIKDMQKLAQFDIVITTYGSVATEFNNRSKKKPGVYPLEEMNWFRIVLDEAHMIRETSTQQSKSICRLAASRRWAVTGTPVQNRLEDLGALMTFLRIKPFDEKGGFAQYIMSPFKMCDPEIIPKLRLLVDSITLRRLKDRIDLPPRHDHLVKLDFSSEERTIYEIFAKNAHDRIKVITGQNEKSLSGKSYVHILQSILRLRLVCAHGRDLLNEEDLKVMDGLSKDSAIDLDSDDDDDRPALSAKVAYDMYNLMRETNSDLCIWCSRKIGPNEDAESDIKDEIIGHMTPCLHIVCNGCIGRYKADAEEFAQGQPQVNCQICHQVIRLSYFQLRQGGLDDQEASRVQTRHTKHGKDLDGYSGPHTKTKALIQDLLMSHQESLLLSDEPPIKSVIFSGWTAHLDLIQHALDENGITFTRLDGKMSRTARGAALDAFRDDPSIHVILVSIMAGGLGLNLTTASKVYVMEPQYNPAAEAQAVDRVHRLGQKREVTTTRYIMNDSFEEKMMELQEKKKKLASLSMDSEGRGRIDKAEAARKRLEDLRSLFK
ncbi:related to helicase-like transcription factor protein [Rhynchosporium agropyri]|uniref:Related to helicase-like transcription factor protein n=1 Tax=Rhynchosporium agropyri TaxID=914238 RepID=A0A1E1K1Y2_9HELO|nr:related to helicase-like transcription factor protein [Rhynchosporium agropyri]